MLRTRPNGRGSYGDRKQLAVDLVANRERRAAAEAELAAARAEFDELLTRGVLELDCYVAEMAKISGLGRAAVQERCARLGVSWTVTKSAPEAPMSLLS
jgi:hypothetical protein